jgi:dUTP pyrophosphatase
MDIYTCLESYSVIIKPKERKLISTGIALEIPKKYGGFIFSRSGLSFKNGIFLCNGVGVIDNDYNGEIKIPLINISTKTYTLKHGSRIAQIIIIPFEKINLIQAKELTKTQRNGKGFGSTGE